MGRRLLLPLLFASLLVAGHCAPILLKSATINADASNAYNFKRPLLHKSVGLNEHLDQFLVQLKTAVTPQLKEKVQMALGWPLGHYLPENTFVVVAPRANVQKLESLEEVAWIGPFLPSYKLSASLSAAAPSSSVSSAAGSAAAAGRVRRLFVTMAADMDVQVLEQAANMWTEQLNEVSSAPVMVKVVSARKLQVFLAANDIQVVSEYLSHQSLVHWVEQAPVLSTQDVHGRQVVHSNVDAAGGVVDEDKDFSLLSDFDVVGLNGRDELIGIGDTGIDTRSCWFYDNSEVPFVYNEQDLPQSKHSKIAGYWAFIDDQEFADGHGSHCANSIAGRHYLYGPNGMKKEGAGAEQRKMAAYRGMAPDARLVFTDVSCSKTTCTCSAANPKACPCPPGGCPYSDRETFLPTDLNEYYFPWSYNMGARIHSNSWGDSLEAGANDYNAFASEVDAFTYSHQDFLPVFAAGNDGRDGYFTISSPGSAKNCLTVGASRTTHQGLQQALEHFQNLDTVAKMVAQQLVDKFCTCARGCDESTNKPCSLAKQLLSAPAPAEKCCEFAKDSAIVALIGNVGANCCKEVKKAALETDPEFTSHSSLAVFSSRGPTFDGRFKPDVVAPGDVIISARAHSTADSTYTCGADSAKDASATFNLVGKSGTSMATPITAGTVALVRQYFRSGFYPTGYPVAANGFSPSAALMKAVLINGAVPLTGKNNEHGVHSLSLFPSSVGLNEPYPSFLQGFGRVALNNSLALAGKTKFDLYVADEKKGVATNEKHSYCFTVNKDHAEVRVTLVWTDPPAAPSAARALVNDLDLRVTSFKRRSHPRQGHEIITNFGNSHLARDASGRTYSARDSLNNVERVLLKGPMTAKYRVDVIGNHVPIGNKQAYALVVTAPFGAERPGPCDHEDPEPEPQLILAESEAVLASAAAAPATPARQAPASSTLLVVGVAVGAAGLLLGIITTSLYFTSSRRVTLADN